jgi:hypothetical protein
MDRDFREQALTHVANTQSEEAKAVTYALLYVGDLLTGVINLLEQIDVTVNNALVSIDKTLEDGL